ncbi:chloride channel protein [Flavobacterium sp.]|uniref:chloride channel protein n=1 Tax=Flavobacterium sp. TaxID=239 RepID=UPI0039E5AB7F
MNPIASIKKNLAFIKLRKLVVAALLVGFLSAMLALTLKHLTEHYENILLAQSQSNRWYLLLFPVLGLSVIFILRQYLFKKKENKGIKEIFESTASKKKNLPIYKIPSHFFNGFLTVIFGGSTGIEVSTVVATATIGSVAQQKENLFRQYKTELISAGVAAGITALFSSPIAGILFALEVISKKRSRTFFLMTGLAVLVAYGLLFIIDEPPLFALDIAVWHYHAIPYFIVLGILAGLHSVYLTKCVLFFKSEFAKIDSHYTRILIGAGLLSVALLLLPQLYGDGYHAITDLIHPKNFSFSPLFLLTLLAVLFVKPLVTSITLASGGDGGVFAPSLFIGAFLGFLIATIGNSLCGADVIPVNFVVIGMAAMLSASIHAPFTALFLVCSLVNDYTLFFPILAICLISKYTAKLIYPFTVYTYAPETLK